MLLSEIFTTLATGELSQVVLGNSQDGNIDLKDQSKVIPAINLGMLELYKKFNVLEKEVVLQLYDHITLYNLNSKYALTNTASTEVYKYIEDSIAAPFQDDVLLIQTIYDELGVPQPLNNLNETSAIFTPSNDIIQVPNPSNDASLAIIYRAKPIKIPQYGIEPASYEVNLPDYLLEPLLFYVASRVIPNVGPSTGEPTFFQKYLGSCDNVKNLHLRNYETFTNSELEKNGWV